MAYDEALAARLRDELSEHPHPFTERAMFGGLGFMVHGNMAVAVSGSDGLLLRCDPDETDAHTEHDGIERFEMRGRKMNGWLHVPVDVVADDDALARWVDVGVAYAAGLPPK